MFHLVKKKESKSPALRELILKAIEKNKEDMKRQKKNKKKGGTSGTDTMLSQEQMEKVNNTLSVIDKEITDNGNIIDGLERKLLDVIKRRGDKK